MKRVILLDAVKTGGGISLPYVLWFPVPVALQPRLASSGRDTAFSGASAAERNAIKAGEVYEELGVYSATSGIVVAQVKADLESRWTTRASELSGTFNSPDVFGTYWDGTTWSTV